MRWDHHSVIRADVRDLDFDFPRCLRAARQCFRSHGDGDPPDSGVARFETQAGAIRRRVHWARVSPDAKACLLRDILNLVTKACTG